jgi:hypothetical protein
MELTEGEPLPGQPLAKTPRTRRRWLIVASLRVLASSVAWWGWPRGVPRFVGGRIVTDEESGSNLLPVVFWASGTGYAVAPDGTRHYFSWAVEDGDLRRVPISRDEFLNRSGDELSAYCQLLRRSPE